MRTYNIKGNKQFRRHLRNAFDRKQMLTVHRIWQLCVERCLRLLIFVRRRGNGSRLQNSIMNLYLQSQPDVIDGLVLKHCGYINYARIECANIGIYKLWHWGNISRDHGCTHAPTDVANMQGWMTMRWCTNECLQTRQLSARRDVARKNGEEKRECTTE